MHGDTNSTHKGGYDSTINAETGTQERKVFQLILLQKNYKLGLLSPKVLVLRHDVSPKHIVGVVLTDRSVPAKAYPRGK